MTVHAIQIVCATEQQNDPPIVPTPAPPVLPDVLPQRVTENVLDRFTEVLSEQAQAMTHITDDSDGGPDMVRGLRRFDAGEDRSTLLDGIVDGVVADVEWYELRYHECEHGAAPADRAGCPAWTAERSYGAVPEGA